MSEKLLIKWRRSSEEKIKIRIIRNGKNSVNKFTNLKFMWKKRSILKVLSRKFKFNKTQLTIRLLFLPIPKMLQLK